MSIHWALRLIHLVYAAFVTIFAWLQRCKRRQPEPLKAHRSKTPKHLCLNLVASNDMPAEETEATFLRCLQSVAAWCRLLGIGMLTIYDRQGVIYRCSADARRRVFLANEASEDSCDSEVEYPLTPPASEPSVSRAHSPECAALPADLNMITMMHQSGLRKRRNVAVRRQPKSNSVSSTSSDLILNIVSRVSGKPAIVSASRVLLHSRVASGGAMASDDGAGHNLTVSKLAKVLEAGLPPPDFMIIHHVGKAKVPQPPLELHGFPPWQNTLTEFHRTHPDDGHFEESDSSPSESPGVAGQISEAAFCRALDGYSRAEFRLGR